MRTNQPGHLKSFDYAGLHRYLLTFCTDYRQHFFVDRANVELVLLQISRAAAETQVAVLAYCFMPDHVHSTLHMARYVLNNPVRAGLVADVRKYPFLGSMKYSLEQLLHGAMEPRSA